MAEDPVFMGAFHRAIAQLQGELPAVLRDGMTGTPYADRPRIGLAIGKAALAMARALGAVEHGLAVTSHDDGAALPAGWQRMVSAHPDPDDRSIVAGDAAIELVERAPADRVIVVLISGGASALVEAPLIPLAELRDLARALMESGAPIADVNAVRTCLSAIKGGGLAQRAAAPIVTLASSDVTGDDLETIGSGPTVGPWLAAPRVDIDLEPAWLERRARALAILRERGLTPPPRLLAPFERAPIVRRDDRAKVVVPMIRFAECLRDQLVQMWGESRVTLVREPLTGDVEQLGPQLDAYTDAFVVLWGEPRVTMPRVHGEGGRMQQLALVLARQFRWSNRKAYCLATDGMDGPPPRKHDTPAGAKVTGATWDAIETSGWNPATSRQRCDAGPALRTVDALIVTGPTGINHADVVVLGY